MAEEFQQAGLCGGGSYYWWNNTASSASPCSTALGSFAWPTATAETRSSCDEEGDAASASDTCLVLGDAQKPNELLLDPTLQMMGFGLSSSDQWCQSNHLLRGSGGGGGEGEGNYNSVLLQDMDSSISSHQIQADWTSPPKSFSSEEDNHSPSNQEYSNTLLNTSAADHNSFANTNNYSGSTLLQSLFEDDHHQQQQPSLFGTTTITNSNVASPFLQQRQAAAHDSSFNTPFWSASAATDLTDNNNIRASFFSPKSQFEEKPNCSGLFASKTNTEQARDSTSAVKRGSDQQAFKRPRIETPSTLPTFKVRKEKLGDRITALQQLVSPFGKTDTASVLHEAIEYIKFLHDQVSVLSSPYMKNGAPLQNQEQQACSDHHQYNVIRKERELLSGGEDLRSRGLCLVPISSTFPVANETTADFWTPTFGATFR